MLQAPEYGYRTVPLRSEEVNVAIIQSKLMIFDPANVDKQKKEALERMLWLADQAQYWDLRRDIRKDLLVFHEFPLQGFHLTGTREEELRIAIDIPGPETEAIGKKAKQYDCYICFGCYGKLKDWPGHFMDMGIIIGPQGDIIYQKWKLRQLSGLAFSTTVYDVLPQFVERYGWDAVFPVARTDIGNLGLAPEVYEPEVSRALALKGAEILVRIMTIGSGYWTSTPLPALRGKGEIHSLRLDFQAGCLQNNVFGAWVNNAAAEERAIGDQAAGYSAIYDCDGRTMAEALSTHETMVIAGLPMAQYRKRHQPPNWFKELYTDQYQHYQPKFPPGALQDYLPKDHQDAIAYFRKLGRR